MPVLLAYTEVSIQAHTFMVCMQHSESPSPRPRQPNRDSIGHAYTVCESPVSLVSPCKDLIAQTGAMLIDSHSMKFASPCYGGQTGSTDHAQELGPQRPPSRQQSSAPGQHPEDAAVCIPGHASDRCQQTQVAHMQPQADQLRASVRHGNEQSCCGEAANNMPPPQSTGIEEIARLNVPIYQNLQGRQQAPTQFAMHMLPMSSSSQFHPASTGWIGSQSGSVPPPNGAPGSFTTDFSANSAPQSSFLPALMLQRQQAQGLPIYSLQQQGVPNSGTAVAVQMCHCSRCVQNSC